MKFGNLVKFTEFAKLFSRLTFVLYGTFAIHVVRLQTRIRMLVIIITYVAR